ncbi:hypothetical protein VM1G_03659 [Cytospora mali]|uniref:Uncharacterized protein n=1 Tax=Cytospora mali TaxID=578113 RepID=A0A194VXY5_CYTMA|nr:hypothetical protein VM1G_03659 [Valsa mali]
MAESEGTPVHGGGNGGGGRQQTPQWVTAKFVLRLILIVASVAAVIVSLVWLEAPNEGGSDILTLLSPYYALPYPVFSIVWESIEMTILFVRHSKSRGMQPVAHLVCELILWMAGVCVGIVWIAITAEYQGDSYFESGNSSIPVDVFNKWADVIYFWGSIALFMAYVHPSPGTDSQTDTDANDAPCRALQFVLFVLACIEVDRKRRNLERQVNHILQIMEDRGQKPEDVLASLVPPSYDSTKPTWPVEMAAMNTDPVEMDVAERPVEVVGDLGARELPVPGEEVGGNQKYVFRA